MDQIEDCLFCGDSFELKETSYNINGFCSEECYLASKYMRGKPKQQKYCKKFNEELKERVRLHFGKCCLMCGKTESENGIALSVHHVNYNKNAGCDDSEILLVPLCRNCHSKVHGNRVYWADYFKKRIDNEYESRCYLTKKEYKAIKKMLAEKERVIINYPITYLKIKPVGNIENGL